MIVGGEPIDHTHRDCLRMHAEINRLFQALKDRAAQWEPRPCPRRP